MTSKAKILLGVNIALIVAIIASLTSTNSSSTLTSDSAFSVQDTASINKIVVGDKEFVKAKEGWKLNGQYQASERKVAFLLSALSRLDIKRPLSEEETQQLTPQISQKGILVQALDANNQILKAFKMLGKEEETYAIVENKPFNIYIPGVNLNIYDFLNTSVQDWRDKKVLYTTWRTLKSLKVEYYGDAENSFEIGFSDKFYSVEGVEKLDSMVLYNYLTQYEDVSVQKFIINNKLKQDLKNAKPLCAISITDLYSERDNTLEIYPSKEQIYGYLVKTDECVLLAPKTLERVLVPKKVFIRKEE